MRLRSGCQWSVWIVSYQLVFSLTHRRDRGFSTEGVDGRLRGHDVEGGVSKATLVGVRDRSPSSDERIDRLNGGYRAIIVGGDTGALIRQHC
jgi:hypothetical protein